MRRVGAILWLALVFCAGVACADTHNDPPAAAGVMTTEALAARIAEGKAPFILDVRTPNEFAEGHVPGAVNVAHSDLGGRLAMLPEDKSAEIVVHCESGRRASVAEKVLLEAGYTNVFDLAGHMRAWRAEQRPTE